MVSSTRPIDADKLHYEQVWIYDIQGGELRGTKSAVVVFAKEIDKNKKARLTDVAPVVHGKWVDIQPPDADRNVQCWCSVCGAGELHAENQVVPYCWKCGAKMDGGDPDAID